MHFANSVNQIGLHSFSIHRRFDSLHGRILESFAFSRFRLFLDSFVWVYSVCACVWREYMDTLTHTCTNNGLWSLSFEFVVRWIQAPSESCSNVYYDYCCSGVLAIVAVVAAVVYFFYLLLTYYFACYYTLAGCQDCAHHDVFNDETSWWARSLLAMLVSLRGGKESNQIKLNPYLTGKKTRQLFFFFFAHCHGHFVCITSVLFTAQLGCLAF